MIEFQNDSPVDVISIGDPGDETANRYRFQWTCAAIFCCMLIDDSQDVEEVFCEHHEDILLKHTDGTFTGNQVKTRDDQQLPWKAKDEAVVDSLAKFVKLETKYPNRFRRFNFLTNHQLYSAGNGQDLAYTLKCIKDSGESEALPKYVSSWVKKIAGTSGASESAVLIALSKTVAHSSLPKLHDSLMRLIHAIVQSWAPSAECSHEAVKRGALALIDECSRASSLDHEQILPAYLISSADEEAQVRSRIDGKRMTLGRVLGVLEAGRDSKAKLDGNPSLYVRPGEGSTDLLHKKLDAGAFSAVTRSSAEDLRNKADYLGIKWTKQFGESNGLARYDHIRTMVLSDAGRAFDATQDDKDCFGPQMRDYLRSCFKARREAGDNLFDASDDHLEGIAFSLTAQCKVVWSLARPWEIEDGLG